MFLRKTARANIDMFKSVERNASLRMLLNRVARQGALFISQSHGAIM